MEITAGARPMPGTLPPQPPSRELESVVAQEFQFATPDSRSAARTAAIIGERTPDEVRTIAQAVRTWLTMKCGPNESAAMSAAAMLGPYDAAGMDDVARAVGMHHMLAPCADKMQEFERLVQDTRLSSRSHITGR